MYTLLDCIKHKCRDSYVLYIPRVHAFGFVLLTHTLLVQTHTQDVSAPLVRIQPLQTLSRARTPNLMNFNCLPRAGSNLDLKPSLIFNFE